MNKAFGWIKVALAVPAVLLFLGFGISSSVVAPPHAVVFVDPSTGVYVAPPCLARRNMALISMPVGTARSLKYEPEPKCRDLGAFLQDARSPSGMLLERLGILGPLPSRWNKDGTWNW